MFSLADGLSFYFAKSNLSPVENFEYIIIWILSCVWNSEITFRKPISS